MSCLRLLPVILCFAALPAAAEEVSPAAPPAALPEATPPDFLTEVEPVLTRFGCNQGACHGKMAGQNGFRLSLRGYAADWDYNWIAREFDGRRIDRGHPEGSLLLLKPTGAVAHGGGKLFDRGSRPYEVLRRWVAAGCPQPDETQPAATGLNVTVAERTLAAGETRRIQVAACFADGSSRDVTWLAQFFSNDESVIRVTADGLATGLRPGETAVRVHFLNFVEPVTLTLPYEHPVQTAEYTERNNVIDTHVLNKLQELHLPPAPPCDDATYLRRASLDTIGRVPTPAEIEIFLADASPNKRERLAEALTERPEFIDYWTLILADLLQNRRELDHDVRGPKGVRAMHAWLRRQVAEDRPWDDIAREVLTASGDTSNNPAVGYAVVTVGEKQRAEESDVASSVAQTFLGARIGCAKCHNHPLEKYTQDDYHHFAAFFSKMSLDRQPANLGPTTLSVASPDETRFHKQIDELETQLRTADAHASSSTLNEEQREAAVKTKDTLVPQLDEARRKLAEAAMQPAQTRQPRTGVLLAPRPLDRSELSLPPGGDPRHALADWITGPAQPQFAGAMVNRLWKHFFAVGLVEPVDDLRASNPPSNPELWNALVTSFMQNNFRIRPMVRLILTSRSYQLSSATQPENANDGRFYSHYYARRLPAEVFLDTLCDATGVPDRFPGYAVGLRAVQIPDPWAESYFLSQFGKPKRTTACACERAGEVSLPQLLHLRNAGELQAKLGDSAGTAAQLLDSGLDDSGVTEQAFLRTLCRKPTAPENTVVVEALQTAPDRAAAVRDLLWALLNTKEFGFNH